MTVEVDGFGATTTEAFDAVAVILARPDWLDWVIDGPVRDVTAVDGTHEAIAHIVHRDHHPWTWSALPAPTTSMRRCP